MTAVGRKDPKDVSPRGAESGFLASRLSLGPGISDNRTMTERDSAAWPRFLTSSVERSYGDNPDTLWRERETERSSDESVVEIGFSAR